MELLEPISDTMSHLHPEPVVVLRYMWLVIVSRFLDAPEEFDVSLLNGYLKKIDVILYSIYEIIIIFTRLTT